jgi:hypothetical protein
MRGGQDDGLRNFDLESVTEVRLRNADDDAGGNGAQGVGDFRRKMVRVVEGENPVFECVGGQFFVAVGQAADERGRWVD